MKYQKKMKWGMRIIVLMVLMLCSKNSGASTEWFHWSEMTTLNQDFQVTAQNDTEIKGKHGVTLLAGQKLEMWQVSNSEDLKKQGMSLSYSLATSGGAVSMVTATGSSISVDETLSVNEAGTIVAQHRGIGYVGVTVTQNGKRKTEYLKVVVEAYDQESNGEDMLTLYHKMDEISVDTIDGEIALQERYQNYYEIIEAQRHLSGYLILSGIQQDGVKNFWGITNAYRMDTVKGQLNSYLKMHALLLQDVKEISEYEGLTLTMNRGVSITDLIGYAYYNGIRYDAAVDSYTGTVEICNTDGTVVLKKTITWKLGIVQLNVKLNTSTIKNATYRLNYYGTGGDVTTVQYQFAKKFHADKKGGYVKSKHALYQSIEKGKKLGYCVKGVRYQVLAVSTSTGWARVKGVDGKIGYIQKKYLTTKPTGKSVVSTHDSKYSYKDMIGDISKLQKYYGSIIQSKVLAKTADNRKVYSICIGNPDAKKCVVIDSTLHAREWLNSQIMMVNLEYYCRNYDQGQYQGVAYSKLFDRVCIYLLPMMNPDGVSISQYGLAGVKDKALRAKVKKLARGNYRRWKANAKGVDLNRNYTPGFGKEDVKSASSMNYGGKSAYSENECRALVDLVEKVKPKAVINYHEAGSIIYYTHNSNLLNRVQKVTGYTRTRSTGGARGTFGDWLDAKKIDYCTIETCSGTAPVGHWQYAGTYRRNRDVMAMAARLYYN